MTNLKICCLLQSDCCLCSVCDEGNTTVDELMMRLMGAMEIFTAQQQEDIKDEVRSKMSSLHRQHYKATLAHTKSKNRQLNYSAVWPNLR